MLKGIGIIFRTPGRDITLKVTFLLTLTSMAGERISGPSGSSKEVSLSRCRTREAGAEGREVSWAWS